MQSKRGLWWIPAFALWLMLFCAAIYFDRFVANYVHMQKIDRAVMGKVFAILMKAPGTFLFAIVIVVVASLLKTLRPRESIFLLLATASSASNTFVKWIVGRTRPFKLEPMSQLQPWVLHPFRGGLLGIFNQKDLSFVSGHACTAAALSCGLILLRPKLWPAAVAISLIVSAERVLENAHFFSDVVGAYALGVGGVMAVWCLTRGWIKATPTHAPGMKDASDDLAKG